MRVLLGAAVVLVCALACRSYDFHGAKCNPADGRCPGGYICAVHRDFPERGNRCIFEAEAQQADAGADAGAGTDADAGGDAGADAGAGAGTDAGAGAGTDAGAGADTSHSSGGVARGRGCGCSLGAPSESMPLVPFLALVLLVFVRRRRPREGRA